MAKTPSKKSAKTAKASAGFGTARPFTSDPLDD
jgi:hypothetical protein